MKFEGDSSNYDVITRAIKVIPSGLEGMTCEIGLRRGMGTKYIIDSLNKKEIPYKVHVAIDPYGHIEYASHEGYAVRLDYTNNMRDDTIGLCHIYANQNNVNFIFLNLTDTQFFEKFAAGIPIYEEEEIVLNKYIFVHFDGPHQLDLLETEFSWFDKRMSIGATIVFDDVVNYYDHSKLDLIVQKAGWKLLESTGCKASYQKIK